MMKHSEKHLHLPFFGLGELWKYIRPYRAIFFSMLLLGLVGTVGDVILPLFQQYAIDNFVAARTLHGLTAFICAYAGVLAVQVYVVNLDCPSGLDPIKSPFDDTGRFESLPLSLETNLKQAHIF